MPDPETVEEAIEQVSLGMIRKQRDQDGREIEFLSVDDMVKADRHLSGKTAATKPHFGMRMTKCIPPGGG
jgi:hypothetical protein